jgi:hypothetical protein
LLDVSATIPLAPGATVDPIASGLRLRMADGAATPLLDVGAPAGAFDGTKRRGWKKQKMAGVWGFTDKSGETSVRNVIVRRVNARALHVSARVQTYLSVSPAATPLLVRVELPGGPCGTVNFSADRCAGRASGDRLLCR